MERIISICAVLFCVIAACPGAWASQGMGSVRQAFMKTTRIVIPEDGRPVDRTVADELRGVLASQAEIVKGSPSDSKEATVRIGIADEGLTQGPEAAPADKDWMYFRLGADGSGELLASKPHLLYALFCQIRDHWAGDDVGTHDGGTLLTARFRWITGMDGFLGTGRRFCRNYEPESAVRELARLGASDVIVNALAQPFSLEEGPRGEIYYRFYAYAPDFDQFVETELNEGTYPPEYLEANLNLLKEQSRLAVKYGLTPGMYIANPRSVPESFLRRYPFLRGARVDHPFRSFRPRYTLTLAHPAVRWHYAQMLRKILKAVPELGFITTLVNDSGSGFEYTASLYPGRNGGPYVVREWRPEKEIARAAAENVIRYYRMLRDVAHETNPDFRILPGLKNIAEESNIIIQGMDDGIDLRVQSQRSDVADEGWLATARNLRERGSYVVSRTLAKGSAYILGVPSPWRTYDNLRGEIERGFDRSEISTDPPSLAPYDVNREVLRAYQLGLSSNVDETVESAAQNWVGEEYAPDLVDIWRLSDEAVRMSPPFRLFAGAGFSWYRLWDRPFVPDIGRIPEEEREYYQKYMLTIFNNPNNVDFRADALWELHSVEESDRFVKRYDTKVWGPLNKAIDLSEAALAKIPEGSPPRRVFADLRDRLVAYRCYSRTLRSLCAWIAGVHGYLDAKDEATRQSRLAMVREMVESELQNARDLLGLWHSSSVDFMPIYATGENGHDYGPNFGELVKKKIELTEKYKGALPYIDPNYMWRMPKSFEVPPEEYLKY